MKLSEIKNRFRNGQSFFTGPNRPSENDYDYIRKVDAKSSTFERSYVITPSGLSYTIGFDKDGKFEKNKVNWNITNRTPSSGEFRVNNIESTIILSPEETPEQGVMKF